ncbi:MAG: murein biosynthesis integral membrane protein MurJ [Patescibacteria group bacterium]|jgi:putative peptidoglycan lipid II flippase
MSVITKRSLGINAGILGMASLLSYILGLWRDRLLAGQFGAGTDLDVFNSSFIIPDIIINLLAAALTTAFIPVFTQLWQQQGKEASWRVVNKLMNLLSLLMLAAVLLAWLFMPQLTHLVAPGFNAEQRLLLIQTTRLMLLSPLLFSISTIFGSTLQGLQRFVSYAISPLLYNVGIVLGIIFLAPRFGIIGVVAGVIAGAGLHMIVRLIELIKTGWRWQWLTDWHDPAIIQTVKLMLPRIIGLLTVQANLWIYNAFGSLLTSGSITVFNLARNFQSLPVSLFGIALASAAFPVLSTAYADKNNIEYQQKLHWTMRQIIFFTVPASLAMIALAQPLIGTLLGTGAFSQEAVLATSITLTMFAISIPLESLLHILARAFYARHNTVAPVIIAVIAMLVNIITCWIASKYIGVTGLALGFVLTALTQVVLLFYWLKRKKIYGQDKTVLITFAKSLLASGLMSLTIWGVYQLHLRTLFTLGIGVMVGTVTYLGLALLLRMPEITSLTSIIKQKIWPKNYGTTPK